MAIRRDHRAVSCTIMLRSPPKGDVLDLLASTQIPSLFVRFESRRVPQGLFSRLILLFYKWSLERWMSLIKPVLSNNVALFHIRPHNATSLVLLCHSSSIEIVLCVGDGVALADEASFSFAFEKNTEHLLRLILTKCTLVYVFMNSFFFVICLPTEH